MLNQLVIKNNNINEYLPKQLVIVCSAEQYDSDTDEIVIFFQYNNVVNENWVERLFKTRYKEVDVFYAASLNKFAGAFVTPDVGTIVFDRKLKLISELHINMSDGVSLIQKFQFLKTAIGSIDIFENNRTFILTEFSKKLPEIEHFYMRLINE